MDFALEANRDGELGNSVEKIRGAIERIDDPVVRLVSAFTLTTFLTEESRNRAAPSSTPRACFLGAAVRGRNEIAGALQRNLQLLARQSRASSARAALRAAAIMTFSRAGRFAWTRAVCL